MLEEILGYINNWFPVKDGIYPDHYEIVNGSIVLPFLQNGQYFRIVGSVFNDGLYNYPPAEMVDETFEGEVWALAVPPAVIALASEIEEWVKNNPESRFTSESFNGYSYTVAANPANGAPMSWQEVFRPRLNRYRRLR